MKEVFDVFREALVESAKQELEEKTGIPHWLQMLYKEIFIETKKAYSKEFAVAKWGMKKVNSTGMYNFGPMNSWDEIFLRFQIGYQDGILFWDMKNHHGKINPPVFRSFPDVITKAVKRHEKDILIRKNSKSFAVFKTTGSKSSLMFRLFLSVKDTGWNIGNDARGGMWLQEKKKKKFRMIPDLEKTQISIFYRDTDEHVLTIENRKGIDMLKMMG